MKSALASWTALGLALALAGCVVTSVYPFYLEKDVVFDATLIGTWKSAKDADSKDTWSFVRADARSYTVTVQSDTTSSFTAHLFKLDERLFLDLAPIERHEDFIPPHYLVKVIRIEPTLQMSVLNHGWLDKLLKATPAAIRHLKIKTGDKEDEYRIVLAADPKELQAFILAQAKSAEAWDEPSELSRLPGRTGRSEDSKP